jgi:hypothetical protein
MSPHWREHSVERTPRPDAEASKEILEEIRRFEEEGVPVSNEQRRGFDEPHHMLIKRKVYQQKGKWKRFPPEALK